MVHGRSRARPAPLGAQRIGGSVMANFHRWYNKDEKDMSPAEKAFFQGEKLLDSHPLFGQLLGSISVDHASQITKRGACL